MWNIKERLVWCPRCNKDYRSDEAAPKCPVCKANLLTVVFSLTGERLTGVLRTEMENTHGRQSS